MKKIFIVLFFLFVIPISSNAEQKMVFIDMEKLLTNSEAGSSILKQINISGNKKLENFKKIESELKIEENEILKQKNIISPEEIKKKILSHKKKINDYRNKRSKIINDIKKIKIENTNKLLKMINPLLAKYAEDNSISLILQKKDIIIGKADLDITQIIIKIVNDNVKEFKL